MEDIKTQQQKLPIDRVAEENIYQELKAQYDAAKQTGYGYRHESDLDTIFRRQAGILAAGGLKSVYEIGTRDVDTFVTLKQGSDAISSRRREEGETAGRVVGVYQRNNDYFYDIDEGEGPNRTVKIDPASIVNVKQGVTPEADPETGNREYYTTGLEIEVRDKPYRELINKRTNEPVYDVELQDNWREDPLAYSFIDDKIVDLMPSKGGFYRIHTNYGVRGAADLSFQMVPDAQGNQVPLILPVYRSTSADPTPLIMAATFLAGGYFLGPSATAGAAGSGATAGTAAGTGAAAGTGTAIVGTPGVSTIYTVANPSIGVSALAPQAIGATGGLLAADAAFAGADAAQLYAQTGNVAAVQQNLIAAGVDPIMAAEAANLAAYGGTGATIGSTLASTFPGETVFTSQGLLSGGSTLDPFAKDIAGITSTADSSIGSILDGLKTGKDILSVANAVDGLLNPPSNQTQPGQQQQPIRRPQSQFSLPAAQPTVVGLLPLAERYRRSLI
jgi:hypothetical protein